MSIELNVFGKYRPGPWKNTAAIIAAGTDWSPSTAELKMFATSGNGDAEECPNVYNLLCGIIRKKPDRINIFTHADDQYIYFSGSVAPGVVNWDTTVPETELDVGFLEGQESDDVLISDGRTRNATYAQFRAALPSRAMISIYGCHAGVNPQTCKHMAKYFRCAVRAFSDEIRYHPHSDKKGNLSLTYSIGGNPEVKTFHELDSYFLAPAYPPALPNPGVKR